MKIIQCTMATVIALASARAEFSSLLDEFQKNNLRLKNQIDVREVSNLDYDILRYSKTWKISASHTNSQNKLDYASSLNFNQVEAKISEVQIAKDTEYGSSFALINTWNSTDRSLWNPLILGGRPVVLNEFSQRIQITQNLGNNFWGRMFQKDLKVAQLEQEIADSLLNTEQQQTYLDFLHAYLDAKQGKSLIILQQRAMQRAETRNGNINRRVKDGLSNEVDGFQSEAFVLVQTENLNKAKIQFQNYLEKLGQFLHRSISENEIQEFQNSADVKIQNPQNSLNSNLKLKISEQQLEKSQLLFNKAKNALFPTIQLIGTYGTNDFSDSKATAQSEGLLFNSQNERAIKLEVSMPIGLLKEKREKEKAHINFMIKEREKKALEENIKLFEQQILQSEQASFSNVGLTIKRRDLNEKNLKGQNRLYNLGRADFDQLIRSEEELINAEIAVVNSLTSFYKIQSLKFNLYTETLGHINQLKGQL